jgi:hypothetical protein
MYALPKSQHGIKAETIYLYYKYKSSSIIKENGRDALPCVSTALIAEKGAFPKKGSLSQSRLCKINFARKVLAKSIWSENRSLAKSIGNENRAL